MDSLVTAAGLYYAAVMFMLLGLMLIFLAFSLFVIFENFLTRVDNGAVRLIATILSGVALLWVLFTIVTLLIV